MRSLPRPLLTVRTGRRYPIYFNVDLGQRNAIIRRGRLTPLADHVRWGDAVTLLPEPRTDLIHSFNAVPVGTRKPHLITFEDYLPRTPDDRRVAWIERVLQRLLMREQCVALLAMSSYALRQFRWQNREFAGLAALEAKTEVLHPGIDVRRERPKQAGNVLRLLFVGNDFMRKGLPVLTRAHAVLLRRGIPLETTVVSSLRWASDDYIGPPSQSFVEAELRGFKQQRLEHVPHLPNAQVLALMKDATFVVLPTFHDTFGYAALEAMAAGTPVVATSTCAMPEIISDGVSGYLLPFENEPVVGKWTWTYRTMEQGYVDAYRRTVDRLAAALADRLTDFWEDSRNKYEDMSAGALHAAATRFGLERARERLEQLYETCRQQ